MNMLCPLFFLNKESFDQGFYKFKNYAFIQLIIKYFKFKRSTVEHYETASINQKIIMLTELYWY